MGRCIAATVFAAGLLVPLGAGAATTADLSQLSADLSQLSIEDLSKVEITSVTKRPQPLSEAPAAIFVITNDDILRSGAAFLPDALRLAPNLQVARVNSETYAITARGFNHSAATANKLQVLIDGRSVYTPLYSGVFWDASSVMLADLDRIEVISGPGGTLWGSNAVNGVINVVTRSARDTQGWLVDAGYGDSDRRVNLRYGGQLGADLSFRIYGMAFSRGDSATLAGANANDSWRSARGGFRADWQGARDAVMLEGETYTGDSQAPPGAVALNDIRGGDVVGQWTHRFQDGGALEFKAYYDRSRRLVSSGIDALTNAYDIDAQYNFRLGDRHVIVIGGGHRITEDDFTPGPHTSFLSPPQQALRLSNLFAQDEIALTSRLKLTAGFKAEHNSYTGWEWMPNARLAWTPADSVLVWAAVSRALRTPARIDRDLVNPGILDGGAGFVSEGLTAYEVGYRSEPSARSSFSVSAYYNVYRDLRSVESTGPTTFPLVIKNGLEGETYGVEAWGAYALTDWWRINAGLSALHEDIRVKPGVPDVLGLSSSGSDPSYQASLRSSMNLPGRIHFDAGLRRVAKLSRSTIPAYTELDARLAWKATRTVELSVTGDNLLHALHTEFDSNSGPPLQLRRTVYAAARWSF